MSLLTKMQFKMENLFNRLVRMIPSTSGKILYNKWVLYFIFVVGIYDVIHFYQRGNTMAVAIFFIIGFLTSFFSKNMIVVIVSAIAVSHIVVYGNKMAEGFEEEEEEEGFEDEEEGEEGFEGDDDAAEEGDAAENKKKDSEDNFEANIEKMQTLLDKTEQILSESKKQDGFTGMFKNDFTSYQ